jgi:uncharacterized alpha-E superfamily protein
MSTHSLLSRVADSVYWIGRYIERAENIARFIDVNLQLSLDSPPGYAQQWSPLIAVTADDEEFCERYQDPNRDNVIRFLSFDAENRNSVISCLRAARENARTVRDTISSEMWEQVNRLYLEMSEGVMRPGSPDSVHDLFHDIKQGCHLFEGITLSTMSHGEAWHFLNLGRSLERADKTTRILDVKYFYLLPSASDVGTSIDDVQWSAVLKSVSGFEMYRKRYGRLMPQHIVEFLLLDAQFPRAVRCCLIEAEESLHCITGTPSGSHRNDAERLLGQLRAELDYTSIGEVVAAGLHEVVDSLQKKINRVDDAIFDTFFAMRTLPAASTATSAQG